MRNDSSISRAVVLLVVLLFTLLPGCDSSNTGSGSTNADPTHAPGFAALSPHQQKYLQEYLLSQAYTPAESSVPSTPNRSNSPTAPSTSPRLLVCKAADVNADGLDDIIIVYTPAKGTEPIPGLQGNVMRVLIATSTAFTATNALPAPVENQHIQLRDIDNTPPLEFMVLGSKGAQTGMGVYRVVDGNVENLFGESMEDCC